MPSFNSTAARITEPTVGASVWASGSQVWNGNIGTLMPNPRNMPAKIHSWLVRAMAAVAPPDSARMSNVRATSSPPSVPSARKYMARKLTSMSAEPNSVNRKNFMAA